jgi:hypothetical protein
MTAASRCAKDIGWGYWRIGSEYLHERSFLTSS